MSELHYIENVLKIIAAVGGIVSAIMLYKSNDMIAFIFGWSITLCICFIISSLYSVSLGTKNYNLYKMEELHGDMLKNGDLIRIKDVSNIEIFGFVSNDKTIEFAVKDLDTEKISPKEIEFEENIEYIPSDENRLEYDAYQRPFGDEKAKNVKVYYNVSEFE